MRSEIPHPCIGSTESTLRISMSSVPRIMSERVRAIRSLGNQEKSSVPKIVHFSR